MLQAAGDQLVSVVNRKHEHRTGRLGATDGIGKEVRKARHAVRVLDSLVRAEVQLEEPLITEWRGAVRVIRGGRPATLPAPVPVSAPTSAGTPSPATEAPKAQAA